MGSCLPAAAPVQGNLLGNGSHPQPAPSAGQKTAQPLQLLAMSGWTASAYLAYPGYKPAAGALGEYNGKFMSGRWCCAADRCATPRSHIRATYRNCLPAGNALQFSGIRLADDAF